jgi:hypothetical protein
MSNILAVLSFFKFIPGLRNKWADSLGLLFWSVLSSVFGVVMIIKDIPMFEEALTSLPYLISFVTSDILNTFTVSLMLFCLAYFIKKNPHLLLESQPLMPRRCIHLLLCTLFHLVAYFLMANGFVFVCTDAVYCVSTYMVFFCAIASLLTMSTGVGIASASFVKNAEVAADVSNFETLEKMSKQMIREFKTMKTGMGPMLFLLFNTKILTLITFSYMIIHSKDLFVTYAGFAPYITLELSYIIFVLDDVFEAFKDTKKSLR